MILHLGVEMLSKVRGTITPLIRGPGLFVRGVFYPLASFVSRTLDKCQ